MTSPPPLAIDASEWFVDEAWRGHVSSRHWRRLPMRADDALRAAATELLEVGARATFFVPATVAFRAPELLASLQDAGHEVALSVRTSAPLDEVSEADRDGYRRAWHEERAALEAAIGRGVQGFAAAWSVGEGEEERWWHPVLRELGFVYDATPVRGETPRARSLDGGGLCVAWFAAWQLDREQPRLTGLPRELREAHEARQQGAAGRLRQLAADSGGPIASAMQLEPAPVGPQPTREQAPESEAASSAPRLAVVVPLMNEAEGVPSLLVELELLGRALSDLVDCEFVLVDDGSTDETWSLLARLARNQQRVRLVKHGVNRGVAAAIRTGMQATDAQLVASIDGDLSYDPLELRHMVPLLDAADVVTASPYHPAGDVRNVPGWRLFLSRTLSRAYQLLLLRRLRTWTSCFRVYRRNAVVHIPIANEGFLGTAELLVRVLRRGGRVAEHPCTLEARLLGFSKMRVFGVVMDHLRLLALVALRVVR